MGDKWEKYTGENMDCLKNSKIEICIPAVFDVEKYQKYYFLDEADDNDALLKIKNKSCKWVENEILGLTGKEKWTRADVLKILAWKTGKIKHSVCNQRTDKSEQSLKDGDFAAGWKMDEDGKCSIQLPYQKKKITKEFSDFADEIIKIRSDYHKANKDNKANKANIDNDCWGSLLDCAENVNGLGTVYLVTLLAFITCKNKIFKYPIYDKFAMRAIIALEIEKQNGILLSRGAVIKNCSLPEKNRAQELLGENSPYMEYKNLLDNRFCGSGEEKSKSWCWKKNREVDQALWVYGHMFNIEG